MCKINIIALLLLFLFSTRDYSQNISNGYYERIERSDKTYIYIYNAN